MAYNKAAEEKKRHLWKEVEEKKLRQLVVGEDVIKKLRDSDWEDLKYSTTNRDGYREYKSDPKNCADCPSRPQCTEARTLDIYIDGSLTGAATWQIFAHGSRFTAATGLTTSTIKAMSYSLFSDIANPTTSSGYYTDGVKLFSGLGGAVYYATFTTAQNSGTFIGCQR